MIALLKDAVCVTNSPIHTFTLVASPCFIQELDSSTRPHPLASFPQPQPEVRPSRAQLLHLYFEAYWRRGTDSRPGGQYSVTLWDPLTRADQSYLLTALWSPISQCCYSWRSLLFAKAKVYKRSSFPRARSATMRFSRFGASPSSTAMAISLLSIMILMDFIVPANTRFKKGSPLSQTT